MGAALAAARKASFLASEAARAIVFPPPPMRILLSPFDAWRGWIERGFRLSRSPHELVFADLSRSPLEDFDLVIPIGGADVRYLSGLGDRMARNPIPIPSIEAIDLCDDKLRFNELLLREGFGTLVPRIGRDQDRPYVLKGRIGTNGRKTHLVLTAEDEMRLKEQIVSEDHLVQALVPGRIEYATHVLFRDGRVVHSLTIRYSFASDRSIMGRAPYLHRSPCGCPHIGTLSDILRAIGFQGLCCFDYKVVDGVPQILELNPRFGGSLAPYLFSFVNGIGRASGT